MVQKRRDRLAKLLSDFSIGHIQDSYGYSLSGGESVVEIARALAKKPDFVLFDEPFVGIDPIAVGDIQEILDSSKSRNRNFDHRP